MTKILTYSILAISLILVASCTNNNVKPVNQYEQQALQLLKKMTIDEKIGQMNQQNTSQYNDSLVKNGLVGSILNETDVDEINRLQKIAVEQTRLGIPLLFGRDVIHGFKTIMPIPLGQAATWNPQLVEKGSVIAAAEARASGINWVFSPMVDVCRDPRWGRIAEGYGEDPVLTSAMGVATINGYQQKNLNCSITVAACVKHFAAYGAAEGGRDYHTVSLPENEIIDVYLPPFKDAAMAGVASFMIAFNEINGVPASANNWLIRNMLRNKWQYNGLLVSDWSSVSQLVVHGVAENNEQAALLSALAGIDMDMASNCYINYLKNLVNTNQLSIKIIDQAVKNILVLKFKLGLFNNPYTNPANYPAVLNNEHKKTAQQLAAESLVLLKNNNSILPIKTVVNKVAVIGPLANAPHDQMGTWVFDGDKQNSVTPLTAITNFLGKQKINYAPGLQISRTLTTNGFEQAVSAAKKSDIILLFIGEESILSGESHCRADINLPGAQTQLINELHSTGKPIVAVVMAGRPLTFEPEAEKLDAIIYAWHGGTMAGPAIADIIFGVQSPSGKLPVTFPRTVGQIPVYYAQKNSGKPATNQTWEHMYKIPPEAPQLSVGNTNHYLDYGFRPWFSFGYGLSYSTFEYSGLKTQSQNYKLTDTLVFCAFVKNTGNYFAAETAQLYIRDLVGSRTRPVKELKAFKKIWLQPGQQTLVEFKIAASQLAYTNLLMQTVTEPGSFKAGIGTNSDVELNIDFTISK